MSADVRARFIFGALFVLANRLQSLGDSLDETVTLKQFQVLTHLQNSQSALSLSEIALWTGSSRQNVTRMVETLAGLKLVEVSASDDDKRARSVTLTPQGRSYLTSRTRLNDAFLNLVFQDFSEQDLDGMRFYIQKLSDSLDHIESMVAEQENVE